MELEVNENKRIGTRANKNVYTHHTPSEVRVSWHSLNYHGRLLKEAEGTSGLEWGWL